MLITVRDLELRPLHFDQEFRPGKSRNAARMISQVSAFSKFAGWKCAPEVQGACLAMSEPSGKHPGGNFLLEE